MPTEVDDADSRIKYSGSWQAYSGGTQSSRQWESSIHSTNQNGASATLTFVGTSVRITCTVPSGSGTNSIGIITLDGQRVATVTRTARSDAVYSDIWYQSSTLSNVQHTITISNGGSSSDSPLQLDVIEVEGNVVNTPEPPVVVVSSSKATPSAKTNPTTTTTPNTDKTSVSSSSSGSSSTTRSSQSGIADSSSSTALTNSSGSSSSTSLTSLSGSASSLSATKLRSGDKTVTQVQVVTTAADGTVSTQTITTPIQPDKQLSASSSPPVGRIVGAVVGSLVLVAIVLLLLCLRRRRRVKGGLFLRLGNSSTAHGVTPFHLEEANVAGTGTNDQPSPTLPLALAGGDSPGGRSEKNAWPTTATGGGANAGEPSDELVDLTLRRWMERHPDILLNRAALLAAFAGQSPPGGGGPGGRFNMSDEDVELGTLMNSMYASSLGSGSSSHHPSEIPPPSYQSSSRNSAHRRRSKSPTRPVSPSVSPPSQAVYA